MKVTQKTMSAAEQMVTDLEQFQAADLIIKDRRDTLLFRMSLSASGGD